MDQYYCKRGGSYDKKLFVRNVVFHIYTFADVNSAKSAKVVYIIADQDKLICLFGGLT